MEHKICAFSLRKKKKRFQTKTGQNVLKILELNNNMIALAYR